MSREIIKAEFEAEVRELFKDRPHIQEFILNHERLSTCIDNLQAEIRKAEWMSAFRITRKHIEFTAREYARTFSKLAMQYAEEQALSQGERSMRIRKADEQKEIAAMFESVDRTKEL